MLKCTVVNIDITPIISFCIESDFMNTNGEIDSPPPSFFYQYQTNNISLVHYSHVVHNRPTYSEWIQAGAEFVLNDNVAQKNHVNTIRNLNIPSKSITLSKLGSNKPLSPMSYIYSYLISIS